MNHISLGFIYEFEKLSAAKEAFTAAMEHGPNLPWRDLSRWQKLRVGAGIGGNVAFGVAPLIAAGAYGVNKLRGKDTYKMKYQKLQSEHNAMEGAIRRHLQSEK
jgi:hypothetical protein